MKGLILFFALCLVGSSAMAALSVEGTYQGKNLYVQNPMDDEGFGYCATKVTVNGDIMPGGTSMGAFEIDFSMFNIEIGEPVFIVIEHNDGCKPKILNPEVLLPRSTFSIKLINVSVGGELKWSTSGEQGKLPFVIEQYRWNKWVAIGEIEGKGSGDENTYNFAVTPHSGENTVRVVQIDHSGTKRPSKEVKFESSTSKVIKTPAKVKNEIKFLSTGSAVETRYEIYDAYGNIVKKGVGSKVNCANLLRGVYYINFDNVNEKFIKN
ncbi:MAG: hypothetical protein ACI865_000077 [Flavobacteriaceae bacterium]|jgi:hypothetical protein